MPPLPNKGYLLLALLCLSPNQKLRRSKAAVEIWEDADGESALRNLRYVLWQIRRWEAKQDQVLVGSDRDFLWLHEQCLPTDVLAFEAFDEQTLAAEELEQTYVGGLLEGLDQAPVAPGSWMDQERLRLESKFIKLAMALAAEKPEAATERVLHQAALLVPDDENLLQARIAYLMKSNRLTEARKLLHSFETECPRVHWHPQTRLLAKSLFPQAHTKVATVIGSGDTKVDLDFDAEPQTGRHSLPRLLILPPTDPLGLHPRSVSLLAESLIHEVVISLGRMRSFCIIASHSARKFNDCAPGMAAEECSADYVINTALFPGTGGSPPARLGFELLDVQNGEQLLADFLPVSPDRTHATSFELATAVSVSVLNRISETEIIRFRKFGEASAFTYYLLGKSALSYDLPHIRKARRYLRRAVSLHPGFHAAEAMLARTLTLEWLALQRKDPDLLYSALSITNKTIKEDGLSPAGYWEQGRALLYLGRVEESIEHTTIAIERAPHIADLLLDKADGYIHLGDGKRALENARRARTLNPYPPDDYFWVEATAHFLLQDYERALFGFNQMRNSEPVARLMAASAAMMGDEQTAAKHRRRWMRKYPDFRLNDWVEVIPQKNPETVDHIVEAMRRAGFY